MKALIGIDTGHSYEPALRLFGRLRFGDVDLKLLNVADLVLPYTSFGVPPTLEATNEFMDALKLAGEHATHEAKKLAASYGLDATTEVISGAVSLTLMDRADEDESDLLVVSSTRKGALAALFTGSVSRGIVSGSRHNVLIAKEGVRKDGPIEAVLATDYSDYAEKAIDRFLAFRPKGIETVHVVTADESEEAWVEEKLREKGANLVGKLSQHGYRADYTLEKGDPNHVIPEQMKRFNAELLILGAQGHGFLDRLFVGSVSFHQLVAEPYSMLILRAGDQR